MFTRHLLNSSICFNDSDCIDYYLFQKKLEKKNVTLDPPHGTLALDMEPSTLDPKQKDRLPIYSRNFPPVGFIQSRTVLLMRRQSNPITPHETWIELWAVYFVRAVLRLYSNTKPSANNSANAFYQGRDHVWVKESELQRCYQRQVIECGKDVLFVFVFVLWQLATTHATGRE